MEQILLTESEHQSALARIDQIFHAKSGTPEGDELHQLIDMVVKYEDEMFADIFS